MIRGLQKLQKSKYNLNLRCYIMCVCVWRFRKKQTVAVKYVWLLYLLKCFIWWYKQHKKQSETIGSIIPFPIASTPPKLYQKPGWTWNRSGSLHCYIGAFLSSSLPCSHCPSTFMILLFPLKSNLISNPLV